MSREEYRPRRQTISSANSTKRNPSRLFARTRYTRRKESRGERERAGTTTLGTVELTLIASVGYIINDAADAAPRRGIISASAFPPWPAISHARAFEVPPGAPATVSTGPTSDYFTSRCAIEAPFSRLIIHGWNWSQRTHFGAINRRSRADHRGILALSI